MKSIGDRSDSNSFFTNTLLNWYTHNHRDLPWRKTTDAYRIWLSEIILQQTRVAQGMPYYERFIEHYPELPDLARADERDVLRLWQGLGYYSRARNMLKTARFINEQLAGKFPQSYHELLGLTGIGSYTAAAIASFAFGEAVVAVDGNVFRFLARFFGVNIDITASSAKREFKEMAEQLQPADQAGIFNQALIEFGALQCRPVSPDCSVCVFKQECFAFKSGRQAEFPVKTKKTKVRDRYLNYIVLTCNDELAMKERKGKDVWKGLFDFYLIESKQKEPDLEVILQQLKENLGLHDFRLIQTVGPYVHLLSHQRIYAHFLKVEVGKQIRESAHDDLRFFSREEIVRLPKPVLISNYLEEYF